MKAPPKALFELVLTDPAAPLVRVPEHWAPAAAEPSPLVRSVTVEGAALRVERVGDRVTRLSAEGGDGQGLVLVVPCAETDRFAGLGEQFQRLPQRGRVVRGWNFDGAIDATYFNAPVLYSSAGWTLVVDTVLPYVADVAAADPCQVRFEVSGGSLIAYLIEAPALEALGLLTEMTGRPPVPPGWVFGVWHNVRSGTEAVLEQARRLREARIPGSVLWVDDHYDERLNHGDAHPGNYPAGAYPDFKALVDGIHELGYKAFTYVTPHVFTGTTSFEEARGVLLPGLIDFWHPLKVRDELVHFEPDAAAILDLRRPEARDLFRRRLRAILTEQGWDGWMQDFGEQVADPELHNRFALLYHAASAAEIAESKPDAAFFARSGYLCAQALAPCIWGGDQTASWSPVHGLPAVLPGGLSAALIGVSTWGPDIDGLAEPGKGFKVSESTGDKELWIRWAQLGAWSPLMRTHLGFKRKPKRPLDLWYDGQTERVFRDLANLHIRLFPYLQSLAVEAAATGVPIMRPLLLHWPDDPECWDLSDQFMLGPSLLVAPVLERGSRRRRVYLPEERWFALNTSTPFDGPGWFEVDAPLEHVPVFQRAGTAVPVLPRAPLTLVDGDILAGRFDLDLWVTTGASSHLTLFDGTQIDVHEDAVRATGPERRYVLQAHGYPAGRGTGEDVDFDLTSVAAAVNAGADRRADWQHFWDRIHKARDADRKGEVAGHRWDLEPDAPRPGEPARVKVRGKDVKKVEVAFTTDGSEPSFVTPSGPHSALISGQPDGTLVRYRVRVDGQVLEDAGPVLEGPHREVPYVRPPSPNYSFFVHEVRPPDWCWDAVIYHALVDRFARADGSRVCGDGELRALDFHGGDLAGLTRRLDYVKDLGANVLWVSPLHTGEMHVAYDVKDFFAVDPHFGTVDDVRRLAAEAHARGIRLLLDLQVSYLGSRHPFALEARRDPRSPYREWFRWHRWPEYYSFFGLGNFILVDHDCRAARDHLLEAARFWLDLGFDGFRLDSAAATSFDFWTEFGAAVRAHKPDAVTIAESVTPPPHVRHFRGRLTGFLDFEASGALRGALTDNPDAEHLARVLTGNQEHFAPDLFRPLFFENHDMPRLSLPVGGDRRRIEMAAVLLMTVGQAPILYYGTEVGVAQTQAGEMDVHARLPMRWEGEQDLEMLEHHKALVKMRHERPELRRGTFRVLEARKSGLFRFERVLGGARTVVTVNLGRRSAGGLPAFGYSIDPD